MATSAGLDLGRFLGDRGEKGEYRIADAVVDLVIVRLLIELAAAGVELPRAMVRKVGAVCTSLGVREGDPRPAIDAALEAQAPGFVKLALSELLRTGGDVMKAARIAQTLGLEPAVAPKTGPPPEGSVPAGPLSRYRLHGK